MAGSRKWIERDEIAEIYESMAQKNPSTTQSEAFMQTAEDIRATALLGNVVGNRTA